MVPYQTPKETFFFNVIQVVIVYHREREGENTLENVEKEWTIIGKHDVGTDVTVWSIEN